MSYFILDPANETKGPYDLDQIRHMWRLGQITKLTLYCEEGYTEWLPLSALTELYESPAPVGMSAYAGLVAQTKPKKSMEDSVASGILKAVAILSAISLIIGIVVWAVNSGNDLRDSNDRAEQLLRH
jgi:hypothetical protein